MYKLPLRIGMNSGDPMHNIVTLVNSICTSELLRDKILNVLITHIKKSIIIKEKERK